MKTAGSKAPSPCKPAPEASIRHHWQYRQPAADCQLIITRREPLLHHCCTIVARLYHLCNSADLSGVTVPKTGQFEPRSLDSDLLGPITYGLRT